MDTYYVTSSSYVFCITFTQIYPWNNFALKRAQFEKIYEKHKNNYNLRTEYHINGEGIKGWIYKIVSTSYWLYTWPPPCHLILSSQKSYNLHILSLSLQVKKTEAYVLLTILCHIDNILNGLWDEKFHLIWHCFWAKARRMDSIRVGIAFKAKGIKGKQKNSKKKKKEWGWFKVTDLFGWS